MPGLAEITNFLQVTDTWATAGQPEEKQFTWIKDAGITTVINLALHDSPKALPDEGNTVRSLEMNYIHIPVEWESPRISDLQTFFHVMDSLRNEKIFIHCVLNMRVSVFLYLYRVLKDEKPSEIVFQDVLKIWQPNERWQSFIQQALTEII